MNSAKNGTPSATILLVDDNEAGRYATSRLLRHAGYGVVEAQNGNEALQLVKNHPDLVLLDVQLPDLSGFEVCRIIKEDPGTALIPVVHLSARYLDSNSLVQGLEGGADGYLSHPVDPPVLVATIKAHLRIRQVEAQRNRLASLLENVSDAVVSTDPEFNILSWNRGAEAVYGWPARDALGKHLNDVVPTRLVHETKKSVLDELYAAGHWQGHLSQQARDGKRLTVFCSATLVRGKHNSPQEIVTINRDVTALQVVEHIRRKAELERALSEQMAAERQRLARELHDGLRQQLVGIRMLSANLYQKLKNRAVPEAGLMQEFTNLVGDANVQVRQLINGLIPPRVDADSLVPALERSASNVEQWYGLLCNVHADSGVRTRIPNAEVANHLFHIAQEAMTNAAKHSKASEIDVSLKTSDDGISLQVHDNGMGLSEDAERRGGMGLTNMRYRAELIEADFIMTSDEGRGTTLTLTLKPQS